VHINPEKRHPSDFALWKLSPEDKSRDMEWDSPWGRGFPGWHVECSAMAMEYLGETIDIHTGGIDHIPIHHTNEIAQSEASTGKRFANYWLHNNFLLVNGTKISKSLNNGITLSEVKQHGFSVFDFKMFVLQSHYRTESNFTWENLEAAKNRLRSIHALADIRWQAGDEQSEVDLNLYKTQITAALNDDLNTPLALSHLSEVVDQILGGKKVSKQELEDFIQFLDKAFGFNLSLRQDVSGEQKAYISEREEARKKQDFAKSDELRAILKGQGIEINDTASGPVWSRT
jgi:cysteinyl-tRNA synthetase